MPVPGLATKTEFERMFPESDMDSTGDAWGHRWRGSQKYRLQRCLEVVRNVIPQDQQVEFLDIGCGQSDWILLLDASFPKINFSGMDISENVIQWNTNKFPQFSYKQCVLPLVDYASNVFDFISALEVIYYLDEENQFQALKNIVSCIKPGGYLLISGVLEGGDNYLNEDIITNMISKLVEIEIVGFNYASCFSEIERILLILLRKCYAVQLLLDLPLEDFQKRMDENDQSKIRVVRILRIPVISHISAALLIILKYILQIIIGWEWLPRFSSAMCRWIRRSRGKSHIIVLGKKTVDHLEL